jgi:hypothetical protein
MATTKDAMTGINGTKKDFPFTFPYLKTTDLKVELFDSSGGRTELDSTKFTFANATTVSLSSGSATDWQETTGAPKSDVTGNVYRNTSSTQLAATFYPGSAIRSADLNDNYTQNLYVTQEAENDANDALNNARVLESGAYVSAITKATTAITTANTATTTANTATTNATNAVSTANTAATNASNAVTTANTASTNATNAVNTANAAYQRDGSVTMTGNISFEGATDDAHETTVTVVDPTADRTITLPNQSGTVPVLAAASNTQVTATPEELNILDGVTSTAAELNILDGVTSTAAELNHVDGVTSNVQTQLDGKQPIAANLTTLAGMQSGTASILAGSTALTSTNAELNLLDGKSVVTSVSGSSTDVQLPTAKAVNDQIVAVINDVGGFTPIADDQKFPNTNPDPGDDAGTIVSIADAGGLVVNGSGVSTTGRTLGGATVTINGIDSSLYSTTIAAGKGMLVQTTSTLNTYDYHRLVVDEAGVADAQTLVSDFNDRYRVNAGEPSSHLTDGDLVFDTSANKMKVYDSSASAWKEVTSAGDFKYLFLCPAGGTGAPTLDGSIATYDLREGSNSGSAATVTNAAQLMVSINGVVQRANTGTSAPAEGFALVDGNTIIFGANLASGDSVFIVQSGSALTINAPGDNTVATATIQNGAVTTAKIADDAVTADKLANSINTEIAANTAKVTNATHTGDVTGSTALTIAALAVETGMIAADAVDGTKIADDSINSEHYVDGSIDTAHIANDAVDATKLADSINTDIAAKAPLASPTFTGTVAIPNIANVETAITAKAPSANPAFTGQLTEEVQITANKLSAAADINLSDGMVHLFTTTETTTSTPNLRWDGSTTLNSKVSTGEALSVTIITTAAAAGFSAQLTIDGAAVTENWVGGSAPDAGGSSGVDIYAYTIIKTASATWTVIANHSTTS